MTKPVTSQLRPALWVGAAPAIFVLLWSTGFIGAKLGLPYAEPFTFLSVRFGILAVLLAVVSLVTRAPWPTTWAIAGHWAVIGILIHGINLGGVFAAIHLGLPAGISALFGGLQPLVTAVVAGPLLGERMTGRQWIGLFVGLAGVILVVAEKLDWAGADLPAIVLSVGAVAGLTAGTLYQKKFGGAVDLRTNATIQFAAAAVVVAIPAFALESLHVNWSGEFIFALSWLVVVLSLGAISLLYLLIRRGAVSKVASLFYLVPPSTAIIAYFLFGETLTVLALVGMAVAVVGVAMATRD